MKRKVKKIKEKSALQFFKEQDSSLIVKDAIENIVDSGSKALYENYISVKEKPFAAKFSA